MSAAQKERQRRKQKILKWKEQDRLHNLQNAVQNASAGTLVQTLLRILSQQQSSIKLPAGVSREAGPGIGEEGSGCQGCEGYGMPLSRTRKGRTIFTRGDGDTAGVGLHEQNLTE